MKNSKGANVEEVEVEEIDIFEVRLDLLDPEMRLKFEYIDKACGVVEHKQVETLKMRIAMEVELEVAKRLGEIDKMYKLFKDIELSKNDSYFLDMKLEVLEDMFDEMILDILAD